MEDEAEWKNRKHVKNEERKPEGRKEVKQRAGGRE